MDESAQHTRVIEVSLPNGATALVRATDVDGGASPKSALANRFDFDEVAATMSGMSEAIRSALTAAAPDQVTVDLGLEMAVKAGKLTALVVEGAGAASLSVRLTWNGGTTSRA